MLQDHPVSPPPPHGEDGSGSGGAGTHGSESVLCGNGSHNRVTGVHIRPSFDFGSVNLLVSGD